MRISEKSIVGEVVATDYRAATVFQSFGIDFCCKGGRSIDEACAARQVVAADVVKALSQVMQGSADESPDVNGWPIDLLADYIEKTHHRYVERRLGEIIPLLQKVVRVHGDRHPEVIEMERLFQACAGELAKHMKKEELVLFPFIRKMVSLDLAGGDIQSPPFGSVANPIAMMQHEHDVEGDRFRQIAALTDDYTPPADACATYRVTYALLREFEADLHRHIHLENNILFPKAKALEGKLAGRPGRAAGVVG